MPATCERCNRPILFPQPEARGVAAHVVACYVAHAYYGCDTGCCGHKCVGVDCNGRDVDCLDSFDFVHPYSAKDAQEHERWAEEFARGKFPGVPLLWERCDVWNDC
jgi:hypothetical protein